MKEPFKNHRGTSLPIVIGLVLLLALASAAINTLIIKNLQSVQKIEASNRAYMAAEAGIEDALYELSGHSAGYETPSLESNNVRKSDFKKNSESIRWEGDWEIKSLSNKKSFTGKFFPKQKLVISLFNDEGGKKNGSLIVKKANQINTSPQNITTLSSINNFSITFRIPKEVYKPGGELPNPDPFANGVIIDNDGDAWKTNLKNGINEDGKNDFGYCGSTGFKGQDADCDGRQNEDSAQDPVIYWKLTDGKGGELTPKKGCLTETDNTLPKGTEICEEDFKLDQTSGTYQVTLHQNSVGSDGKTTIASFIKEAKKGSKLKLELFITAPLLQVDKFDRKKIPIPYLEYEVKSDSKNIPLPFFTIKSDGWFSDFKQSLTTTVIPKTVAPIFEFTILQQ